MTKQKQGPDSSDYLPLGRFHVNLSQLLGEGNFGQVYLGYDEANRRPIAVKHIPKNKYLKCRYIVERQIKIMEQLQHENVLKLYKYKEDPNDGLFMFLQLCEKESLDKMITKQLTQEQTYAYFKQLVEAMAYINSQKICHRDLKPQNLLLTGEGQLKVADFGIARQFIQQSLNPKFTIQACTQQYGAPQVMFQDTNYDQKCDVYSAAYILYQMLTSQKIYQQEAKFYPQLDMVRLLSKVKSQGGWKLNHPAIRDKP